MGGVAFRAEALCRDIESRIFELQGSGGAWNASPETTAWVLTFLLARHPSGNSFSPVSGPFERGRAFLSGLGEGAIRENAEKAAVASFWTACLHETGLPKPREAAGKIVGSGAVVEMVADRFRDAEVRNAFYRWFLDSGEETDGTNSATRFLAFLEREQSDRNARLLFLLRGCGVETEEKPAFLADDGTTSRDAIADPESFLLLAKAQYAMGGETWRNGQKAFFAAVADAWRNTPPDAANLAAWARIGIVLCEKKSTEGVPSTGALAPPKGTPVRVKRKPAVENRS